MKVNLSVQEMEDLVDAIDMARDRIIYDMHGLTDESRAQAVRFTFLKDRFIEYLGGDDA